MTFTLKDYNTLKSSFADTCSLMEKREQETSTIRSEQINFLNDVIKILDDKITKSSLSSNKKITTAERDQRAIKIATQKGEAQLTLTSAMVFISYLIDNEPQGSSNSLLRNRLWLEDMNINERDKPTSWQYKVMYQQLNQFLQLIFNHNNALENINKDHLLNKTKIETLIKWMEKSYKNEFDYFIEALPNNKNNTANNTKETEESLIPTKLIFDIKPFKLEDLELPNWSSFTAEIKDLILTKVAKHNQYNSKKIPNSDRANQLSFLKALNDQLGSASLDPNQKSAILLGAMHLIREQIGTEQYGKRLFSCKSTSSTTHTKLSQILAIDTHYPSRVAPLVTMAQAFIMHTNIKTNEDQTLSFYSNNALSESLQNTVIKLLKLSQEILYNVKLEKLKNAHKNYQRDNPEEIKPTLFSRLNLFSNSKSSILANSKESPSPTPQESEEKAPQPA